MGELAASAQPAAAAATGAAGSKVETMARMLHEQQEEVTEKEVESEFSDDVDRVIEICKSHSEDAERFAERRLQDYVVEDEEMLHTRP